MTIPQYLEMLSNDSSNAYYFVDVETNEVLYMNQVFLKKFQVFEEYQGKKCTDELAQASGTCALCENVELKEGVFTEQRIYSERLGAHLRSNSTVITVQGRKVLMTKFFLSSVDKRRADANQSFEEAMASCLDIISLPDRNTAMITFLELLGKFYGSELTYIYEFHREKNVISSRNYWCAKGHNSKIPDSAETEKLTKFLDWLEEEPMEDLILIEADSENAKLNFFHDYGVLNGIISKINDKNGRVVGIVGVSNCTTPLYDNRLLKAAARFVTEAFNEQSMARVLQSFHEVDLLTGFYNRTMYGEKLTQLHENPPEKLGVLFINMNGLRKTNEYFGFEVGDVQIKKTAALLKEEFSEEFFRISGDEFVAFVTESEKEEFEEKVNALHAKLKEHGTDTSFSLGHAWASGSFSVTNLVKTADTVMTINKQAFYSYAFKESEEISNTILQDLFRAIAEDEFLVYLQPQIRLKTEEVVGAEALIRRFDKKHQKMIFPDYFIPLYEKNSIIRHVDLFVIRKVCQILLNWKGHEKTLPISVNLSRVTLMEHGIVTTISDILKEYHIPPELIIIEVTERIGLIENEVASTLVEEFKEHGFKLSLDDFGCAYSNIVTLSQITVDEVKIDKSLVDNLSTNAKNRVIVKNMLSMCNEFEDTSTLAEGIETEEQAEFLRSVHCHMGQGYLYSRPIPSEEFFEKYIKNKL